jgi:heme/copper-type cytochrome/quinol oxidase subunit 1
MHGVTMIFWYASPILSGFAVYLVPLMIGARDMAFPAVDGTVELPLAMLQFSFLSAKAE